MRLEIRGLGYQFRVPKLEVSPRSTSKQGGGDLKLAAVTRDDVAKRLGVSISTVRRLEGTRLHPLIGERCRRVRTPNAEIC